MRRALFILAAIAVTWAAVVHVVGGVVIHVAGVTISSHAPRNPLLFGLILGLVVRLPWTADDRRVLRAQLARARQWCSEANRHPGPDAARAWTVVSVGVTMLATMWVMRPPNVGGDTAVLLAGTDAIARCLSLHEFVRCGTVGSTDTFVGPFALFQHLPDLALAEVALSRHSRIIALWLLSAGSFFGLQVVARRTLRSIGDAPSYPTFLIVLLTSPFLDYASTTWGEPLAAFLTLAFVAASLTDVRPRTMAVAAAAATLTKETAFPFLGLLGVAGLVLAHQRTGRSVRARFIAMTCGIAAGLALAAVFNVFRFGSVLNAHYMQTKYRVEDMAVRAEFFAGLLVSPNQGIVFHWTAASVLLTLAVCVPIALRLRRRSCPVVPAAVLAVLMGGLTAMLSLWWAPYGGNAWGPRLSLPWVPALVLYAIAAYGHRAGPLGARFLRSNVRLVALALVLVIVALPHVGFLLGHDAMQARFDAGPSCNANMNLGLLSTREGWRVYLTCLHFLTWNRSPALVEALRETATLPGMTFAAIWVLTMGALLQLLRLSLNTRQTDV